MQARLLLVHPLPAVSSYNLAIQPVNSFRLGLNALAVVPPELMDIITVRWNVQQPLAIQRAAGDAVGVCVMVLGDTVIIPVGFGVPASGGKHYAWESHIQLPQEARHDLIQHR